MIKKEVKKVPKNAFIRRKSIEIQKSFNNQTEISNLIKNNKDESIKQYELLNNLLLQGFAELNKNITSLKNQTPIKSKSKKTIIYKNKHKGVVCDVCHKREFTGRRYKCLICSNFDMCGDCE